MLFVNKFGSHLKQYITHDMPDLVFKNVCLFNMNQTHVCLFKVNNIEYR